MAQKPMLRGEVGFRNLKSSDAFGARPMVGRALSVMYCFSPRVASARVSLNKREACALCCALCAVWLCEISQLSATCGGSRREAKAARYDADHDLLSRRRLTSAMMNNTRFLSRACREMSFLNALPEGARFLG